ncbi:hypothetical protein ES332_D06G115700v1 [Gossypium tomentosum]|uniref:Uncharacterized protein n=1 Tax=Gossypium tomentosum TaxID=34277 RepID=A0A5D2KGU0_GOSTO|nr:hypothetical protein ES332_D06G115700v1 [Gossypium tomentosum]
MHRVCFASSSPPPPPLFVWLRMSSSSLPKEGNRGKMKMKGIEGDTSVGGSGRYIFNLTRIISEDIIFYVDVDAESLVEMKTSGVTRFNSIKQSILLFINSNHSIKPDHCLLA